MDLTTTMKSGEPSSTVSELPKSEAVATNPEQVAQPKQDLIARVSQVKVAAEVGQESGVSNVSDENTFDINEIDKIQDPAARDAAMRAYKSFQRGFDRKFKEVAEMRRQVESQAQPKPWTPERIRQELLTNPEFLQASQSVLQDHNPPDSGMSDTEWSSLTASEKKQWQSMQNELASLKNQQVQQQIAEDYKRQDDALKSKYANYNSQAVDILTNDLLTGKVQATREHIFKALDYESAVKRAYELGKQDSLAERQEKLNASAYDGFVTGKPAMDSPAAEKNESTQSFFRRLVANNVVKQQAQR